MKLVVSDGRDLRVHDISGSANWVNKADLGLVVHRGAPQNGPTRTDILIRKVRSKSVGKIGGVALRWDRAIGRYREHTDNRPAGDVTARTYRDA